MSNTDKAKIYTFYSYKGGVGRSMALANIAELLYRKGLRVLMVDFDLEAPGLEQYFYESDDPELHKLLCKRGMIDLLFSYRSLRALSDPNQLAQNSTEPLQETSTSSEVNGGSESINFPYAVEPLSNFVHNISPALPNRPGTLSIMTAGRRAKVELTPESEAKKPKEEFALYADRVRSFAWDDFYLNFDGELFFEWFREEAIKDVDIVLIDSRTGVAEMSGVCTYQLADVVAMFVAANHQNVEGIKKVAESLTSNELIKEGRKGRELSLIFVPSRVDLTGEKHKLDDLAIRFRQVADRLISPTLRFVTDSFVDLRIPYISYYSFVEEIAVRDSKSPAAIEMRKAYERICRSFAQLDPKVEAKLRVGSESADSDNLAEQQNRVAEQVFNQLELRDQVAARGLFTRLVRAAQVDEGELKDSARSVRVADLTVQEIEVANEFAGAGLLVFSQDADNQRIVALAEETLIDSWSRLKEWISEDRDFLLWRQKLWTGAGDWVKSGRQAALLLQSAKYVEAEKWYSSHQRYLTHIESDFIDASRARRRRERWLKYAASILFLGSLAVLIYVFWFRKTSTSEEARSRQLASNSEAVLSYLPDQSLLLAVEAVRLSPTVEAQQALRHVLQQSRLRTVIRVGGTVYSAQFSHDGTRIVTGSGGSYNVAQIWEPGSVNRWQNLLILKGHEGEVRAAAFSPDDKLVATASYDGTSILWDAVTGQMIGPRSAATHMSLSDLAWSSDGRLVAAASLATNQVYVWHVPGMKLVKTLVGFTDNVNSVSFSPSGNFLAAGSKDNSVLVWDVKTWKQAAPPLLGHTNEVLSVRFSPDGRFLVTTGGENTARVWSTSEWRTVTVFSGHFNRITRASFSPDGKLIVTASADNSAKIWETLTGKLIAELRGSLSTVNDASFSPDGKLILTAAGDGTARLWDLNPEISSNSSMAELTALACTRVSRNLTEEEWRQFMGNEPYRATCSDIPLPQPSPTSTATSSPVLQSSNSVRRTTGKPRRG